MSTSVELGLIKGLPASAAALNDLPASTSTWQSIANNWNHTADERSRVLVNYAQKSTTTGGRSVVNSTPVWERLFSFGPFPILIGDDGLCYPIRLRIGGRADKGGTSYLRVGVCPVGRADDLMGTTGTVTSAVLETASFTSTTNAWRIGGMAVCPVVGSTLAIVDAVSSATPRSVAVVMATIEAWGKNPTGVTLDATCTQVHASEYCGL